MGGSGSGLGIWGGGDFGGEIIMVVNRMFF
jgi:hypothetical protein